MKSKTISTQQILSSLPNKEVTELQDISREIAKILSEQEKETEKAIAENEEKLKLIRGNK